MTTIQVDDWTGCYPSNWKGVIVEDAMSHPAKYSSKLIRRIYKHLVDEGWVKAGDRVIDPFGGVALGAYDALRLGLDWVGMELEERFYKIGQDNIHLWGERYGAMPTWGTARLLHGDSRKLLEVVGKVEGQMSKVVVTSPPYGDSFANNAGGNHEEIFPSIGKGGEIKGRIYGNAGGNLGNMDSSNFAASIASPPFLQSDGGTPEPKPGGVIDRAMYERHAAGNHKAGGYGRSDGQLHHMKDGGFDAAIRKDEGGGMKDEFEIAVSSPPFEDSLSRDRVDAASWRKLAREMGISNSEHISAIDMEKIGKRDQTYGVTAGQLAEESGDDFWMAAREIVEQVYQSLTPGGHAVWVVKDYVKSKKVVPFCDQWRQLCEAVGFETLHEHHAMLVHARQMTLEGGVHVKESKSFFRRIAEKNGSPRIDFEVVYCMVKGR